MDVALARIRLNVTDQATIVSDGHADRQMRGVLQGRTVQAEDEAASAGTLISGETFRATFPCTVSRRVGRSRCSAKIPAAGSRLECDRF